MNKEKIHSSLNLLLDNIEGTNLLLEYYTEFGQKITQCRDFKTVIQVLHQELRKIYAKQQLEFILWQGADKLLKFVYDSARGKVQSPEEIKTAGTLYHHALEQQQTILTNNYKTFCDNLGVDARYVDASSWLGIPLLVRGKVLGMLVVWDNSVERYFRLQDKQFLSIITFITAFALENISLYDYIVEKNEPVSQIAHPSTLQISTPSQAEPKEQLLDLLLQAGKLSFAGLFMRSQSHDLWREMGCRWRDETQKKFKDL
ncbi:MAG: GAF domain-containing protein, partial [bacterium]